MNETLRPADFLPHRPPMILLAELISVDVPEEASAVADTSPGCIFYDPELRGVPACAALEYMAQTMALPFWLHSAPIWMRRAPAHPIMK